jgi:hypothetical protein
MYANDEMLNQDLEFDGSSDNLASNPDPALVCVRTRPDLPPSRPAGMDEFAAALPADIIRLSVSPVIVHRGVRNTPESVILRRRPCRHRHVRAAGFKNESSAGGRYSL